MNDKSELQACIAGITAWQTAFNEQDAAGCAQQYEPEAVMEARPFGTFKGRDEIQAFWQNIMDQGYAEVEYSDVTWGAHERGGYILRAKWQMNKAFGVVHLEHWAVQSDGKARLVSDDFEIQGER